MALRWIVGNWLRSEASRRARAGVADAARRYAEDAQAAEEDDTDPDDTDEPQPCDVGLVFALGIEAGGFLDKLSGVVATRGAGFVAREGGLDGRRIVVIESGPKREQAARATAALIAGHQPRWVISAGFAGGLTSDLSRCDIVMADSVVVPGGERLAIDVKMPSSAHLHVGRLLTVDDVVHSPEEKRRLGREHKSLAVDLETYAVAEVCRDKKVRFLSIRVISDAVDDTLPAEVDNLISQKTLAGKLGAATGSIWRRPSSIKDMWQLKEDALVSSERLAKFLTEIIRQLP